MTFSALLRALDARRAGASWMAHCPAHDDCNPSLSLREIDGKTLLRCHAGCSQHDVIEALRRLGLWGSMTTTKATDHRLVAKYDYRDERGVLLYQVVRYEPKAFRHRHPDGRGGWIWTRGPRQVLYRLPEILESPIVFVVEGEKDVETLRAHGFVATTNSGGADSAWLPEFTETLRGREVILIPDNDGPGKARALRIARCLLGNVVRLVLLQLEGGAKDISDWFGQGHSELDLIALVEGVRVSR